MAGRFLIHKIGVAVVAFATGVATSTRFNRDEIASHSHPMDINIKLDAHAGVKKELQVGNHKIRLAGNIQATVRKIHDE